jgi:hypothetical protein
MQWQNVSAELIWFHQSQRMCQGEWELHWLYLGIKASRMWLPILASTQIADLVRKSIPRDYFNTSSHRVIIITLMTSFLLMLTYDLVKCKIFLFGSRVARPSRYHARGIMAIILLLEHFYGQNSSILILVAIKVGCFTFSYVAEITSFSQANSRDAWHY